jgi:hypothetical protein
MRGTRTVKNGGGNGAVDDGAVVRSANVKRFRFENHANANKSTEKKLSNLEKDPRDNFRNYRRTFGRTFGGMNKNKPHQRLKRLPKPILLPQPKTEANQPKTEANNKMIKQERKKQAFRKDETVPSKEGPGRQRKPNSLKPNSLKQGSQSGLQNSENKVFQKSTNNKKHAFYYEINNTDLKQNRDMYRRNTTKNGPGRTRSNTNLVASERALDNLVARNQKARNKKANARNLNNNNAKKNNAPKSNAARNGPPTMPTIKRQNNIRALAKKLKFNNTKSQEMIAQEIINTEFNGEAKRTKILELFKQFMKQNPSFQNATNLQIKQKIMDMYNSIERMLRLFGSEIQTEFWQTNTEIKSISIHKQIIQYQTFDSPRHTTVVYGDGMLTPNLDLIGSSAISSIANAVSHGALHRLEELQIHGSEIETRGRNAFSTAFLSKGALPNLKLLKIGTETIINARKDKENELGSGVRWGYIIFGDQKAKYRYLGVHDNAQRSSAPTRNSGSVSASHEPQRKGTQ